MALNYIVLTALSIRKATGYDLTKDIPDLLGSRWETCHKQIYRALSLMHDKGWLSYEVESQTGKPDRKIYTITDWGHEALSEWFQKPISYPNTRDELSAKLMGCNLYSPEPMLHHIGVLLDESHTQLTHIKDKENSEVTHQPELTRKARIERLMLRRDIHNMQANIKWAEEALTELDEINRL